MKKYNKKPKKTEEPILPGMRLTDAEIGRIFLSFVDNYYRKEENLERVLGRHESIEGYFIENLYRQFKDFRIKMALYPERLADYLLNDYKVDERFLSEREPYIMEMYDPIRKVLSSYDDFEPALQAIGSCVKKSPVFTGDIPLSISTKFRIRKKQLKSLKTAYETLEKRLYSAQ